MAWYALVCGFLGAHLFSVLFYFPDDLAPLTSDSAARRSP